MKGQLGWPACDRVQVIGRHRQSLDYPMSVQAGTQGCEDLCMRPMHGYFILETSSRKIGLPPVGGNGLLSTRIFATEFTIHGCDDKNAKHTRAPLPPCALASVRKPANQSTSFTC